MTTTRTTPGSSPLDEVARLLIVRHATGIGRADWRLNSRHSGGSQEVASFGTVPSPRDAQLAEEARQRSIAEYATNAQAWWESGRTYYIVKLSLGGTVAGLTEHRDLEGEDVSGVLQQVEAVGWLLDDIGYVYQPLRERSHALTTSNIMTGNIVGIYTFRRPSPPPPPA